MIKVGNHIKLTTNALWLVKSIDDRGAWLMSIKHGVPGFVDTEKLKDATIIKQEKDFFEELTKL